MFRTLIVFKQDICIGPLTRISMFVQRFLYTVIPYFFNTECSWCAGDDNGIYLQ